MLAGSQFLESFLSLGVRISGMLIILIQVCCHFFFSKIPHRSLIVIMLIPRNYFEVLIPVPRLPPPLFNISAKCTLSKELPVTFT